MVTPVEISLLASTTAVLLTKLLSVFISRIEKFSKVNDNLHQLEIRAHRVQEKLDQLTPPLIEQWKPLVRELTALYYDVDDIIDGIKVSEMSRRNFRHMIKRLMHLRSCSVRQPYHEVPSNITNNARMHILSKLTSWGLPHKISELLRKFIRFEEEIDRSLGSQNTPPNNNCDSQILPPGDAVPLPAGRNVDRESIVQKLLGGAGVSIVGMAGLGKTALARSIVDDAGIRNHFHIICWGSAAAGLDNMKFFYLHGVKAHDRPMRSLLVLDELHGEVFSSNLMAWENFRCRYLQPEASIITNLITARDPRVAFNTHTTPYYLKRMSDEDCKELIRMRVVTTGVLHSPDLNYFERKASSIAKKCMGLPLVATIIALTLCAQCRRQENVTNIITLFATRDIRELSETREGPRLEGIFRALKLENSRKPSCLNKLLAYFSLFPHGYKFSKKSLLQLWMAEGFIQPEKWTNWEQARQCFDDMLPTLMVEPSPDHGEDQNDPSTYQMHEIHGMFAQSIASNMCYRVDRHSLHPTNDIRHLSLCCKTKNPHLFDEIADCSGLRTFLSPHANGTGIGDEVPRSLFQKLLLLRVLDLSQSHITIVPNSIHNLKHLRYLDFSNTSIKILPESTCKLIALRVLKLINCPHLMHLPKKLGNLINLILLDLTETILSSVPPNIGKLTSLETLPKFIVMKEKGYQISELRYLNALGGSLKIMELEKVKNVEEASKASLISKSKLRSLELHWTEISMPEPSAALAILNELQPHENLEELRVTNYGGEASPRWFRSSLSCHSNLQSIHLCHWPRCRVLPQFWKLPSLRTLHLDSIHGLERVGRQFFGDHRNEERFASLECLEFHNMRNLYEWNGLMQGDIPCLRDLKFINCPELAVMPTLHHITSLKNLTIDDCNQLINEPFLPEGLESYDFQRVEIRPLINLQ